MPEWSHVRIIRFSGTTQFSNLFICYCFNVTCDSFAQLFPPFCLFSRAVGKFEEIVGLLSLNSRNLKLRRFRSASLWTNIPMLLSSVSLTLSVSISLSLSFSAISLPLFYLAFLALTPGSSFAGTQLRTSYELFFVLHVDISVCYI